MLKKEELLAKMRDERVVVINVLPKSAFQKLHIKGSENIPLTEDHQAFTVEVLKTHGKDKDFVTYGHHFGLLDSYEASAALIAGGLKAQNYSGGMQDWFAAGYPSEGSTVVLREPAPPANPPSFQ